MRYFAAVLTLLTMACASRQAPLQPVNGPESPELLQEVRSSIIATEADKLFLHQFPGGETRELPTVPGRSIWSLTGPDADGAFFAATDNRSKWTEHNVVRFGADGSVTELFRGDGGILWHHAIGDIAVANSGRVALVSKQGNLSDYKPLLEGSLDIWDPSTRQKRPLGIMAYAERPAWFPDGRRLLFFALTGRPPVEDSTDERDWPMLRIVDVESGAIRDLTRGFAALLSTDGQSVLVTRGGKEGVVLVDVATGNAKPVDVPGLLRAPIAFLDGRYVIYRGRPTAGAATSWSTNNSPLVGAKPMHTIKLADLQTGRFVTLIPAIDPRVTVTASLTSAR